MKIFCICFLGGFALLPSVVMASSFESVTIGGNEYLGQSLRLTKRIMMPEPMTLAPNTAVRVKPEPTNLSWRAGYYGFYLRSNRRLAHDLLLGISVLVSPDITLDGDINTVFSPNDSYEMGRFSLSGTFATRIGKRAPVLAYEDDDDVELDEDERQQLVNKKKYASVDDEAPLDERSVLTFGWGTGIAKHRFGMGAASGTMVYQGFFEGSVVFAPNPDLNFGVSVRHYHYSDYGLFLNLSPGADVIKPIAAPTGLLGYNPLLGGLPDWVFSGIFSVRLSENWDLDLSMGASSYPGSDLFSEFAELYFLRYLGKNWRLGLGGAGFAYDGSSAPSGLLMVSVNF